MRHRLAARLLCSLVLVVTACAQAQSSTSPPAPSTSASTAPLPVLTEPLTGRVIDQNRAARLNRPAVAIKISDVRESQPEININQADIVICEPNGVSYTRLAAVFHSKLPDEVGPIRSIRPADAALLSPLKPVFANSSASASVLAYISKTADVDNLSTVTPGVWASGGYSIDPTRAAPNHVIAHPKTLLKLSSFTAPPRPYFRYAATAAEASVANGEAATKVSIPYGPSYAVSYRYDKAKKRYLRSQPWGPHVLADGTQVSAKNIVIIAVDFHMGSVGGHDQPVPILNLIDASGTMTLVSGGKTVRGTWTKGAVSEPFVFTTGDGKPLLLTPGTTFVELPTPQANVAVRG